MPIKVMIPTALRSFAGGQNTITLEGATVGEVLGQLNEQCPELKRHLYADDGSLRNFVNVFVNDANIRDRENQDTPIADGDELSIVPSIAGGTGHCSVSADSTGSH